MMGELLRMPERRDQDGSEFTPAIPPDEAAPAAPTDLTERLAAAEERARRAEEKAYFDRSTGVSTIAGLDDYLETTYGISFSDPDIHDPNKPPLTHAGFIVADVCDLKRVNDNPEWGGHKVGDAMLKDAAQGMQEIAKTFTAQDEEAGVNARVTRLGGDEFGVLVTFPDHMSQDDMTRVMHELQTKLTEGLSQLDPEDWNKYQKGSRIKPVVAFGSAVAPLTRPSDDQEQGYTLQSVVEAADQKMYTHKKRLKAGGIVEGRDEPEAAADRLKRDAIRRARMATHYAQSAATPRKPGLDISA